MKHKEKQPTSETATSAVYQGLMKVLLVDDSPYFLKAATRFLSDFDAVAAVATVRSGSEAVQAVMRDCPDLVLIDINMPGMSGLAAVRRIRTIAPPELRVIVVSLNESADFRAAAEAAGADGYIAKRDFAAGIVALLAGETQRLPEER
jgi:two-component system, NarL family, nitrate/nitrite response regulator NarL